MLRRGRRYNQVLRLVGLALSLCLIAVFFMFRALTPDSVPSRNDSAQNQPPSTVIASSSHRLCLLVPFRDRFEELQAFVPYMRRFLDAKHLAYEILILNQVDEYRFNRASLINVGYHEAIRFGCDYVCMHDVDLVPLNLELPYSYPEHGPLHIASPDYHPRYHYKKFIGGILMMTTDDFLLINGMSNKYWGWGLEDDELFLRLRDANLTLVRPVGLSTGRNNTFAHMHDARLRTRDNLKLPKQREMTRRRDRISGLDTVRYQVLTRSNITIDGYACHVINIQLHCNKTWTPYCELPRTTSLSTSNTSFTTSTTITNRSHTVL